MDNYLILLGTIFGGFSRHLRRPTHAGVVCPRPPGWIRRIIALNFDGSYKVRTYRHDAIHIFPLVWLIIVIICMYECTLESARHQTEYASIIYIL